MRSRTGDACSPGSIALSRLVRIVWPVLASVLALGGCSPNYPKGTYFENPQEWDKVVDYWKREYENACITLPNMPVAEEYVSPKLMQAPSLNVAIVGVIQEQVRPPQGVMPYPPSGAGAARDWQYVRWGTSNLPAASVVDAREKLLGHAEMYLANVPRIRMVDRVTLKMVFNERDLRQVFATPSEITRLGKVQGADAIVIASAGELEYLVYSVTLQDNGAPFLWWSRRSEATVRMRMVDVSDGTLLWSASVSMGPEGVILVPVIHHATANKELPESLTATPSAGAREAAHYLIRRLAWHMSGRRTEFPSEDRMILANHRNRAWTTGH